MCDFLCLLYSVPVCLCAVQKPQKVTHTNRLVCLNRCLGHWVYVCLFMSSAQLSCVPLNLCVCVWRGVCAKSVCHTCTKFVFLDNRHLVFDFLCLVKKSVLIQVCIKRSELNGCNVFFVTDDYCQCTTRSYKTYLRLKPIIISIHRLYIILYLCTS